MKKLLFLGLGLFLFLSITPVFAQGGGDNGKTYYDVERTKPKEVFSFKSVGNNNQRDRHGPYFYYHENGKLKVSGQYRDNLKHGDWKYFDERGTLTKTEKYESGRLVN